MRTKDPTQLKNERKQSNRKGEGKHHNSRFWGLTEKALGTTSVVLTRYTMRSLIGFEDMVFGENFDDSVQVVARPDSVENLEFVAYFDQETNRVQ